MRLRSASCTAVGRSLIPNCAADEILGVLVHIHTHKIPGGDVDVSYSLRRYAMHLSPIETALNMHVPAPAADLHTYGFPPGYFIIKNVANDRLLDVQSDEVEDGTPVILWPETETSLVEGTVILESYSVQL